MRARPRSATQDSGPSPRPSAEEAGHGTTRNTRAVFRGVPRPGSDGDRPRGDGSEDSIRPAADAKQLALERLVDPGAGMVLGDPLRLQQVVSNLLSNAVKFTPAGGR